MKRGDIYFANLDPTIGNEIRKKRPVLIVSRDISNKKFSLVTVVPITSNITRINIFEVLLEIKDSNLPKRSKVQCHQIRTISKLRLDTKKVGAVTPIMMEKVERALKIHLYIN